MTKIMRLDLTKLQQGELVSFNDRIIGFLESCCGSQKSFVHFKIKTQDFSLLLIDKINMAPDNLKDYHKAMHRAWSAFNLYLKAIVVHPDREMSQAAEKIFHVFSAIKNPFNLHYMLVCGEIRILLTRLSELPPDLFAQTNSEPYLKALEQATESFDQALSRKIDKESQRRVGEIKKAAAECGKAWQSLIKYLELRSEFEQDKVLMQAISTVNYFCSNLKRRIECRRRAGGKAPIDVRNIAGDSEERE